jgi:type I restriction enzyme S subunit
VSGKCWINNHAHVILPTPSIDIYFLSEYLESIKYDEYNTGTAQPKLNREKCNGIPIAVPSLNEQKRIAKVLSDVDSMISSLEKLIAKKKAIKQGAMQELLTGKNRLSGFTGEWKKIELKELIKEFIVPMRDKPKDLSGPIPWCRIEDFNGKYLYSSKTNQGVTIETISNMNLKVFPKNTLLVSCSAFLGRCAIVGSELITNQTFIGLVPNNKVNVEFLFYIMIGEEKNLNLLSSGTTISYLSREQFEDYKIYIPCDVLEQTAIASILSDMDNEIEVLEQKLEKTRQIKQGMMQQLLTGKIRLV